MAEPKPEKLKANAIGIYGKIYIEEPDCRRLVNEALALKAANVEKLKAFPKLVNALEAVCDWADEYDATDPPFVTARDALALYRKTKAQ